jgi:hypothetical protein
MKDFAGYSIYMGVVCYNHLMYLLATSDALVADGIAHARILIASKALFRNQKKMLFIWSGFHHIYLIPPLPPIDHTIPAHIF